MTLLKKLIRAALVESEVPSGIAKERLEICAKCPLLQDDTCTACGCFASIKSHMGYNKNPKKGFRVEKTHCPLGKWVGIDETTGTKYYNDKDIANFYRAKDGKPLLTIKLD